MSLKYESNFELVIDGNICIAITKALEEYRTIYSHPAALSNYKIFVNDLSTQTDEISITFIPKFKNNGTPPEGLEWLFYEFIDEPSHTFYFDPISLKLTRHHGERM